MESTNAANHRSNLVLLASHSDQLPKSFHDNRNVTTGRFSVPPWKMAHGHLFYCHSKPGDLSEDFRVNHRAHGMDLNFVENTAIEDLEGAIDVADPHP